MSRRLHLSPANSGVLKAFDDAFNIDIFQEQAGSLNTYSIIGGQFIQSGVNKIYAGQTPVNHLNKLKFLGDKVQIYKREKYLEILDKVFSLIKFYVPSYIQSNKNKNEIDEKLFSLEIFLCELFFSLKHNTSFPIFLKIPIIEEYKTFLPLEFYKPLEFFFNCIKIEDAKLPTLKRIVDKEHIVNFKKVVETRLYLDYCKTHLELDNSGTSLVKSVRNIEILGKGLYNKNSRILSFNNALISTIEMSAKLIDLFAGKLPGVFAEFSAKLFSDAIKKEQRIIMYDCRNTVHEILIDRVNKFKS